MTREDFQTLIETWQHRMEGKSMDEEPGTRQCLGELSDTLDCVEIDEAREGRLSPTLALPNRPQFWQDMLVMDPPVKRIDLAGMTAGEVSDVISDVINMGVDSAEEAAAVAWAITRGAYLGRLRVAMEAADRWLSIVVLARDLDESSLTDPVEATAVWVERKQHIDLAQG